MKLDFLQKNKIEYFNLLLKTFAQVSRQSKFIAILTRE